MSDTATEAPSLANAIDTARPNPELAPVTMATFPLNLIRCCSALLLGRTLWIAPRNQDFKSFGGCALGHPRTATSLKANYPAPPYSSEAPAGFVLDVPTLIIWGLQDEYFSHAEAVLLDGLYFHLNHRAPG